MKAPPSLSRISVSISSATCVASLRILAKSVARNLALSRELRAVRGRGPWHPPCWSGGMMKASVFARSKVLLDVWNVLSFLLLATTPGCGSMFPAECTAIYEPGLHVTVTDGQTGSTICDASVTATDTKSGLSGALLSMPHGLDGKSACNYVG